MTLAIEPMLNVGTWQTKALDDGWTVVTADGELSAHFEHTIAVTENGPEILTPGPLFKKVPIWLIRSYMPKENESIEVEGTVKEGLPNASSKLNWPMGMRYWRIFLEIAGELHKSVAWGSGVG
ncbi:MAG: hypothetical protein CM1200mP3_07030 [Chloroflexota bacterium]|nr:MAG: hypothetical protein CM1200mP3_07030 [Chloroflexota bacterium]